jgi:hypothetical protein
MPYRVILPNTTVHCDTAEEAVALALGHAPPKHDPPRGRPRRGSVKTRIERVVMYATISEKALMVAAATRAGLDVSTWVRAVAVHEARRRTQTDAAERSPMIPHG